VSSKDDELLMKSLYELKAHNI